MKKDNRTAIRSLKCAMAFVLAAGMVPIAPAVADEDTGAQAATEDGASAASDAVMNSSTNSVETPIIETPAASEISDDIGKGSAVETPNMSKSVQDGIVADNDTTALSMAEADQTADDEASETAVQDAQSNSWQTWGTCEWMVDDQGVTVLGGLDAIGDFNAHNVNTEIACAPGDVLTNIATIGQEAFFGTIHRPDRQTALFSGLNNLTMADVSSLDTSNVKSMESLFQDCASLSALDLSGWDTSSVNNMTAMLYQCSSLASLNLSGWNVSNTTKLSSMFAGCSSLTALDLSDWNTSSATDMDGLFSECSSLTSLNIASFNTSKTTNMSGMFGGCSSLTSLDAADWNTSSATNMSDMFAGCTSLKTLDVSKWNTSAVTTIDHMFKNCTSLSSLDPSGWNTSNLQYLNEAFAYCTSIPSLSISAWDTSSATSMVGTFRDCSSLASLDLSGWNTSKAVYMENMFTNCRCLKSLNLSAFDAAASGCSSRANSGYPFNGCYNLQHLTIGNKFNCDMPAPGGEGSTGLWVESSSRVCYEPDSIPKSTPGSYNAQIAISDTMFTIDTSDLFYNASAHEPVVNSNVVPSASYLVSYRDNVNAGQATAVVTGLGAYTGTCELKFEISKALPPFTLPEPIVAKPGQTLADLTLPEGFSWQDPSASVGETGEREFPTTYTPADTTNYWTLHNISVTVRVTDLPASWQTWGTCEWMVDDQGCLTIRPANGATDAQLPDSQKDSIPWCAGGIRSGIKTIVVEPGVKTSASCSWLFCGLDRLEKADLSHLDTSSATIMDGMFTKCRRLTSLDVSSWNTSSVRDMTGMFYGCSSLTSLNVSAWNTTGATDLGGMFYNCTSLVSLDLSGWDTSNVTDMGTMFYNCPSLVSLDAPSWDTSKVTSMSGMFMGCRSLESLDVSSWNTSNVANMSGMFYDCSSVTSLDVSKWDVSRVTGMKETFKNCSSLSSLDLSGWDASNVSSIEDMLSGNSGLRHIAVSDKLACDMPTPNFEGATGLWVDTATGTAYEPDAVPKNTAATYDAQTKTIYAHSTTTSQGGVTFTVQWNDAPAGQATTFHVTQMGGSPNAKVRMDVPTYWDPDGTQESVCDPSRNQWSGVSSYKTIGDNGYDFTFEFTASGSYNVYFYFMDTDNNVGYLRTTDVWTSVNDASHPSVSQIVSNAVTQAKTETDGSEYAMALWLHDWTLDQLEYDHDLNWCSAESGLTRHQGTCESYQRIYAKLLNAAGIANGRITGNGHTWNAAKIDGKWCQMDLTWDDTNDNWYGDLDQRHLYFGLTDELMAIAHSDHTKNYQAEGYAYRSTDLSNNYFARNGKADEWAAKYADRIQQHLDDKETSFSIDADNGTFPPSISGIQNAIIAYAMNQRDWSTAETSVTLAATSNVVVNSSTSWTVRYDVEAGYSATTYYVKYYLSENCSALVFEDSAPFDSPYALKGFSELTGSGEQATRFMGWKMRRDSDGKWFARNASGARFVALNDGKLPDGFSFVLVKDAGKLLKAASAGSGVSLYAQLKNEDTYQIKYYPSESGSEPVAEQVVPYSRSAPIASLSSLGLSDDSSSFKGWKMRRSSDGKWFAQDQTGIKRYVGLIDGKLPDGYDYCLLKDGANLLRAASVGSSVGLYAVMDSPSYVVEYFSAGDAGEPVKSVVAPYATAYQLESIESLGLLGDGKMFVGWKLHRVADDKWYAVSNGKTRYVSLVDGELPAGYSYRLVRDEGNLLKAAPQGTTLQLFAQWG